MILLESLNFRFNSVTYECLILIYDLENMVFILFLSLVINYKP